MRLKERQIGYLLGAACGILITILAFQLLERHNIRQWQIEKVHVRKLMEQLKEINDAELKEVQQFHYWINGTESPDTKYMLLIYPSDDPDNYDRITIYIDLYDDVGYIDGYGGFRVLLREALEHQPSNPLCRKFWRG